MILRTKLSIERTYSKIFEMLNIHYKWKLTPNDITIANSLYYYNYKLMNSIKDFNIRMLKLFSKEHKEDLLKELNIGYNTFNNSLTRLRKSSLIIDNKLNSKLSNIDINKESIDLIIKIEHE